MIETLPSNPLYYAAFVAALVGLALHYLYFDAFIKENYRGLKWMRRLAFPFITRGINKVEEETGKDLEDVYVETNINPDSRVLTIDCSGREHEDVLDEVEPILKKIGFRPELILASLGRVDGNGIEVGNWVLTSPRRSHIKSNKLNGLHEVALMFAAKNQLHLRIFYDSEEDELNFYVHFERNPYNPFYAYDHFTGEGLDFTEGKTLFESEVWNRLYMDFLVDYEGEYDYVAEKLFVVKGQ